MSWGATVSVAPQLVVGCRRAGKQDPGEVVGLVVGQGQALPVDTEEGDHPGECQVLVAVDQRVVTGATSCMDLDSSSVPGPSASVKRSVQVMLRLGLAVVGVLDMPRAVAFWTAALDLVPTEEWQSEHWTTLNYADGSRRALGLQYSESPVEAHPRIHLDLFVDTTAEQQAEVERLVALGAQTLDWDSYPDNPDFVVLADPDGNAFCVVDLSRSSST